jgi:hypothetical protein
MNGADKSALIYALVVLLIAGPAIAIAFGWVNHG